MTGRLKKGPAAAKDKISQTSRSQSPPLRDRSNPAAGPDAAPAARRRRVGPEDEERGQQTDDHRFNRDD
jgi:hypothetical protein